MKCKICHQKPARKGRKCYVCHQRQYKNRHPMRYAYNVLKQNAKRRGKPFNLSWIEFLTFAFATHYINRKGKSSDSWSIDRINNQEGYTVGNIRLVTVAVNSSKGASDDFDYPF